MFLNLFLWCKAEFSFQSSVSHDLQKSFYADLVLNKHFLLSVLKSVVLIHIFVEMVIHFVSGLFMNRKLKRKAFIWNGNLLQQCKRLYCLFWMVVYLSDPARGVSQSQQDSNTPALKLISDTSRGSSWTCWTKHFLHPEQYINVFSSSRYH